MQFDDCKPGMRVAHITAGDGTVLTVGDVVEVKFDRKKPGRPKIGIYTRDWFEVHQNYLFRRSYSEKAGA